MQLQNAVNVVNDFQETLTADSMVAVWLSNYDKFPVIGKILETKELEINLHYWKGSYCKEWTPHMVYSKSKQKQSVPWTQWDSMASERVRYFKWIYID